MKKLITVFTLVLCTIPLFATDIRQVMFGNNYETIHEISSEAVFNEYPNIKFYVEKLWIEEFSRNNTKQIYYYKSFRQIIGEKKFIRVVKAVNELTDEYILNWRNPGGNTNHPYLVQLFYIKNPNEIFAVGPMCMMDADGYSWENGTDNKYQMIEIIQRNNTVKGFLLNCLEDKIDHHNRAEESGIHEEIYINTAEYYLFDDVINNAMETNGKVKYVKSYYDFPCVEIKTDQPLIDKKRPFMYTIQNAFDGNPATAYVENTEDDLFEIQFSFYLSKKYVTVTSFMLINGYAASEKLYKSNNRIKKFYFPSYRIDSNNENKEVLRDKFWKTYKNLYLRDSPIPFTLEIPRLRFSSFTFKVSELASGDKYNDSCLAEFNINTLEYSSLFGD